MFCRKTGGPRAKKGQKATEVYPKWDVLQENWGTSGEKRAKSDQGVPEMGYFAGELGDLGRKTGKKRPKCTPLTGIIVEKQGTKVNFFQG